MSKRNCVAGRERFPTTRIQRAYFVGRQPDLPLGGKECVALLAFAGKRVDEQKLRQALEKVAILPALRSRFLDADFVTQGEINVPELKVHHRHRTHQAEHESAVRERLFAHAVDLTAGRLWEVELTQWHDDTTTLHIAISLAVVDLAGLAALMHHLAQCYHGEPLLAPFTSASHHYQQLSETRARSERKRQQKQGKLAKLAQGRMDELPAPPDLPFTTFRPALENPSDVMVRRSRFYDDKQWSALRKQAAGLGVAPSALVLALYSRALRLCSTAPDFIVTVTHVPATGSEKLLAERTVTYAHRARNAPTLAALVRDTQDDFHYRLLRGVDSETELRSALADAAHPHPGLSPYIFTYAAQQPVFDARVMETFGQPRMWGQTPQAVIDCQVFQLNDGLIEVAFDVRRAAIAADIDGAVFDLLTESLDAVIAGRSVENVLPQASQTFRRRVNSTPVASPPAMLFSAFRRQVKKRPQAIALVASPAGEDVAPEFVDPLAGRVSQQWCYAELDELALRLAARLAEHTAAGDIIGIRLPKGPSQIVAVLATFYAGCTYLPVGLDMPDDRLAKIRRRSAMRYLLTATDFADLAQQTPLTELRIPFESPDALAYVIFTSGSTGEPKGVAVSHRAANNTIVDVNTRHNVTEKDALLAVSSLDFDLSVYDIFGPLSSGGTIVTINENERRDAFRWASLVKSHRVTLWNSVPALADMLVTAEDNLPSVRAWLCSGDWIAPALFSRLKACSPHSVLVAMGGSTEAAIWSNEYVLNEPDDLKAHWPSIPYGLPLSGQQYRVVREEEAGHFIDCPDGVTGELWIGGEGLAQGYLGDPERSAERFVYDADDSRWYRTGDLGYWREGLLFFVGRLDTQVKVHGHRVECGEVEQTLKSIAGIDNAVVVPIRERRALGAVLVGDVGERDVDALHQQLSRQLPHYMIPARFLVREALPLNRNGKIDRQWAASELASDEPARQPTAQQVHPTHFSACQQTWCQVLQRDSVSAADNFFALGGDSLAATRVCALLQSRGIDVAVGDLFATSTLECFARRCQQGVVPKPCITAFDDAQHCQPFPLTSLQRAYALGADGIPGVSRCDTVFSVIMRSRCPLAHWQQVLDELIRETAALRLVRTETHQQVMSAKPVSLITLPEQHALEAYLARTPLDARHNPPLMLVTVAGQPARIGLMFNYLGLDAQSLMHILQALVARVNDEALALDSHIAPFISYAQSQTPACRAWHPDDWQPPHVPTALAAPAIGRIESLTYHLDSAARRQLEARAQHTCVTLSALVLHAFSEAIMPLSDRPQVVVVVPVCWRPDNAPQALGQFTQLRLCRLAQGDTPADVAYALADAVAGHTPDDRYIASQGRAAYPFVFTCTAGMAEVESLYRDILWSHTRTPGVMIDCQVQPAGEGLEIRWDYAAGRLDTSQLLAAHKRFVAQLMPGGAQIAEQAIAAALAVIGDVPAALQPVVAAWRRWTLPDADRAWQEPGKFLAACIHGERPRSDLLRHPLLAPERLLLASLQHIHFFDRLIAALRADFPGAQSALRVLILGAGSGVFSQALAQAAAANALTLIVNEYERNEALNTLAQRAGLPDEQAVPDVVIAPASLHRDDALLSRLAAIHAHKPVRLYVLEVTAPDAASLVSAILDPTVVDGGQSPLLSAEIWAQRLAEHGASLMQTEPLAANLVWVTATLSGRGAEKTLPCVAPGERTQVEAEIARCWAAVLELELPLPPAADFFALGGDSLRATHIVTTLRQQGHAAVKLADLFNHHTFADFVDRVMAQHTTAPALPVIAGGQSANFPLTALQKAYLAGRSPEQLLGGVASHCYFEFSLPQGVDKTRLQQALSEVVARHDALRARIVWQDGEPFGEVTAHIPAAVDVSENVRALTESETPDPVQDYPLRVRITPDGKTIGIGMDNLMLDGTSMFLLLRELGARYQGKPVVALPAITYAHYRNQCREASQTVAVQAMPPAPCLPYLAALEKVSQPHFARSTCDVDEGVWRAVRQQAGQLRITPVALLLAAYALEIAALAPQPAFSLNVTTFERDPDIPGVANLVGDFTRLGLVAFDIEPAATDDQQLAEQARVAHQGLLALHDTPEQVSTLRVARERVRQQGEPLAGLFPVVFTSGLGLDVGTARSDEFGFGTLTYARSQTPQVAMDFQVHDDVRGLHITVDYVRELLASEQVNALTAGVARRLQAWVAPSASSGLSAQIAQIWRQHLPAEAAPLPENFFQSGGDSLQATRCIRALQQEIDTRISLRLLLTYPRLSDFCTQVAGLIAQPLPPAGSRTDYEEGTL
ncbi:amino acid adenylation domain-containing protein [Kosakonia sp. H02]|nr:amino acid adenylation domain-containing protein [Kosakonia sp. H02]